MSAPGENFLFWKSNKMKYIFFFLSLPTNEPIILRLVQMTDVGSAPGKLVRFKNLHFWVSISQIGLAGAGKHNWESIRLLTQRPEFHSADEYFPVAKNVRHQFIQISLTNENYWRTADLNSPLSERERSPNKSVQWRMHLEGGCNDVIYSTTQLYNQHQQPQRTTKAIDPRTGELRLQVSSRPR